jgi:glycosyl transferase family 1
METSPTRVIFVTRVFPYPAFTGALQYSAQLLDSLAHMFDEVHVICGIKGEWGRPGETIGPPDNAIFYTYDMHPLPLWRRVASLEPSACITFLSEAASPQLGAALSKSPQLIVVDHLGSSWVLNHLHAEMPIVYCTHNDELLARLSIARQNRNPVTAIAHLFDAWRIYRRDKRLCRRSCLVTSISKADMRSQMRRYAGAKMAYWPPCVLKPRAPLPRITAETPRRIVLLGSLLWSAKRINLLRFLRQNAAGLHAAGIEIAIAGRAEPRFLKRVATQYPYLILYGEVDDLDPVLRDVRVALLYGEAGGGFRMTTLTYVFVGRPILARPELLEDLELASGEAFIACDDEREFHLAIRDIIDDVPYLNAVSDRAREACAPFGTPERLRERVQTGIEESVPHTLADGISPTAGPNGGTEFANS